MKTCDQCKHENPATAKFCNNCGAKLSELQAGADPSIPGSDASLEQQVRQAERRQLTILFCDLVDSTRLSEQLDPEEYRQVILDYHQIAEEVINQYGGYIGNYLGDGLLAYFGYPKGLEDAPMASVRAGLGILKAIDLTNQDWESEGKSTIKIRIGIHTGLTVVDEHLALGETVNIAARLESLAPHNGLVISPQTLKLVQGWFEYKSIGEHVLKGISQPLEVFQILHETGAKTRLEVAKSKGLSPLVGRQQELKKLIELWAQVKNGNGQMAILKGEAGIGKSRLVDAVQERVVQESDNQVLETRCSSYHQNSAFYPIIELFEKSLLQFATSDQPEEKLHKLQQFVDSTGLESEIAVPLLTEFLSVPSELFPPLIISPFAKRQATMEVLIGGLLGYASKQPVLLVVEDLHWADASTLAWLGLVVKKLQDHSVLLLCTTRPRPKQDWMQETGISNISLQRLAPDDILDICLHQTEGKVLPEAILEEIAKKTEGVPLFVEELTKMILESELLVEKGDGFEIAGTLSSLSIPSTLQDSLLSRLDRLSNIREVVHVASVLGREFSFEMLSAILPRDSGVMQESLTKLLEAEILTFSATGDQSLYQFRHALIRDTAYQSMLKSRRRQLHQKTAEVLEHQFGEVSGSQPELLAYHLTEAALFEQAVPLWLQAGQMASKQNAATEAIAHLEKGIELLPHIKNEVERNGMELDIRLTMGGSYVVSHGFPHPKVKETFDQARELAQTMGVNPKLALILFNLLSYYFNTEDYQAVDELSDHMMKLAKDSEHGYWFKLFANFLGHGSRIVRGELEYAQRSFERTKALFDPSLPFPWELAPSGYLEVGAKSWMMAGLQLLGHMDQAKKLCDQHLSYAEHHKDSMTLYHIYTFPALYKLFAREWKDAEAAIEAYLPIVRKYGDPVFNLTAEVYYYIAKAYQGDRESFETAVNLLNVCFEVGFSAFAVSMCQFIAELYFNLEEYQSCLSWISRIEDHVKATGSNINDAELSRIKGLALKELGKSNDEVEQALTRALEIAGDQSSKTYELRAAVSLGRIWQQQGRRKQAHDLIEGVYSWFTEGFDSVDLKQARTLLDELEGESISK